MRWWCDILSMGVIVAGHPLARIGRVLVYVVLAASSSSWTAAAAATTATTTTTVRAFGFLLAYSVDAGAGVDVVVDGPVGAFTAIGEWPGNFLEARIEREIVSDGVLEDNSKKQALNIRMGSRDTRENKSI